MKRGSTLAAIRPRHAKEITPSIPIITSVLPTQRAWVIAVQVRDQCLNDSHTK